MLLLAVLAPLLHLAAAVPAPAPAPEAAPTPVGELTFPEGFNNTEWLAKRQNDGSGVHLVNCDGFGGEGTIIPPNSMVVVRSPSYAIPRTLNANHRGKKQCYSTAPTMDSATVSHPTTTNASCRRTSSSPGRARPRRAHSPAASVSPGLSTPTLRASPTLLMLGELPSSTPLLFMRC